MMMHSVELYRRLQAGDRLRPGWVECGGIRLASSEERMEELRRQAGWAKTFGLPLELISAEEAQELFPLMSTEGVLGAAWLPTDGYIDPSQLTYALADGARARRLPDLHRHAGDRDRGRARAPGARRAHRPRRRRVPRSSSTPAACSPRRSRGWPACACRCVPMSHQYLVTQPPTRFARPRRPATSALCRPCATPTCSSTTARTATGW